jgi:hypothetical protein
LFEGGGKKKVVRRMNDGDILYFDRDDPAKPKADKILGSKESIEEAKQKHAELTGWVKPPEAKYPGWTYTGFQMRKKKW